MRSLSVIGANHDATEIPFLICRDESTQETFSLRITPQLRATINDTPEAPVESGITPPSQEISPSVSNEYNSHPTAPENSYLSPREIQHRIRSGQSVDEVAQSSGCDREKVERFAHPVLLERSRVTLMALQAHPIRHDGPAESKLSTLISQALLSRGILPDSAQWDAWRAPEGFWIVRLSWHAGKSENHAHWQYYPGSHGGTVMELDDFAKELTNPQFQRSLQSVTGASKRVLNEKIYEAHDDSIEVMLEDASMENHLELIQPNPAAPLRKKKSRNRASVPAWEDVLLGVRSAQS